MYLLSLGMLRGFPGPPRLVVGVTYPILGLSCWTQSAPRPNVTPSKANQSKTWEINSKEHGTWPHDMKSPANGCWSGGLPLGDVSLLSLSRRFLSPQHSSMLQGRQSYWTGEFPAVHQNQRTMQAEAYFNFLAPTGSSSWQMWLVRISNALTCKSRQPPRVGLGRPFCILHRSIFGRMRPSWPANTSTTSSIRRLYLADMPEIEHVQTIPTILSELQPPSSRFPRPSIFPQ